MGLDAGVGIGLGFMKGKPADTIGEYSGWSVTALGTLQKISTPTSQGEGYAAGVGAPFNIGGHYTLGGESRQIYSTVE